MAIPNLLEALERTVFETVRLVLVSTGYLPDIKNFDVENPNLEIAKLAQKSYEGAITTIKNSGKGFAIEIFNYSTTQQRGRLKPPRIIIDSEGFYPGEIGLGTSPRYNRQADGSFLKIETVEQTSDFFFNIRLISNTTKQYRVLEGVKAMTLPRQGYLKWYNKDFLASGNLFFKYVSFSYQNWENEGIIEKVYRYMIPDAHEVDPNIIGSTAAITQINFDIKEE